MSIVKSRKLKPDENRVMALAMLIREFEAERNFVFPFENIERIAKKNGFTDDEVAELLVEYF